MLLGQTWLFSISLEISITGLNPLCDTIKMVLFVRVHKVLVGSSPVYSGRSNGEKVLPSGPGETCVLAALIVVCSQLQIKASRIRSTTWLVGGRHLLREMTWMSSRPQWCRAARIGSRWLVWLLMQLCGQGEPTRWAPQWSSKICHIYCKDTAV